MFMFLVLLTLYPINFRLAGFVKAANVRTQLKTIAMSFKETQEQTDIKGNTSHDTVT